MSSLALQNQFPLTKLTGSKFPVKASVLHRNLEVASNFSTWMKRQIERYEFVKNVDFEIRQPKSCSSGSKSGTSKSDYYLTLNMSKELAMVEETEIGRRVRKYFLECERQLLTTSLSEEVDYRDKRGKMVTNEYGTKYVPEVPMEEKTMIIVAEAAEELGLEEGKHFIVNLSESEKLTGMFYYNVRRVLGIERKNAQIALCLQGKLHVRELKSKYFEPQISLTLQRSYQYQERLVPQLPQHSQPHDSFAQKSVRGQ
jgi:phage anti-repressor protein